MKTGRPHHRNEKKAYRDLADLSLNVTDIAARNGMSPRTVYNLARHHGVDMSLRSRIVNAILEDQVVKTSIRYQLQHLEDLLAMHENLVSEGKKKFLEQFKGKGGS